MQADTQNSAALKHRAAPLLLCLCITLFLSACQTSSHKPAPPAGEAVQTDIAATLAEVDQLVMQGQFEQALVLLQAGLAMQPESVDLAIRLGELYELLGDSRLARSTYEATLLREPGQVAVYENLGLLHLKSDRPELAERFLREALQLDETRIKAANTFATADSQSPLKAYNGLGILYSRRGQHEAAAEFFTTGLQIRPSALLYNNLGYARFLQGNTGGAEWAYLQALELVPGYRPAIRNLALLHGSKGHYGRAESLILEQGQKGAEWHDLHQIALLLGDATRATEYQTRLQNGRPAAQVFESGRPDAAENNDPVVVAPPENQEASAEQNATGETYATVRARTLNVREEGAKDAAIVTKVYKGSRVSVIEEGEIWAKVAIEKPWGKVEGWVSRYYLD